MVTRRVFLGLMLLGGLLLSGCPAGDGGGDGNGGSGKSADVAGRKIRVVTTIGMIADIAKNVGGERVEVTALMGPGVDPHYYKATAGNVDTLKRADIIFYNGLHLEGRMTDIFENLARSGKTTVAVAQDVPKELLRQPREFEGRYDPHIWFDVTL